MCAASRPPHTARRHFLLNLTLLPSPLTVDGHDAALSLRARSYTLCTYSGHTPVTPARRASPRRTADCTAHRVPCRVACRAACRVVPRAVSCRGPCRAACRVVPRAVSCRAATCRVVLYRVVMPCECHYRAPTTELPRRLHGRARCGAARRGNQPVGQGSSPPLPSPANSPRLTATPPAYRA